MIVDYVDGQDQIFAQFRTCLPAIAAILPGGIKQVYQGVSEEEKIEQQIFWCRIAIQTALEQQATLKGGPQRRYTTDGIVFVQLFIPKVPNTNYRLGQRIAVIIKNAFRGKQTDGCLWFRRTRIVESLPEQDGFQRLDVLSDYQYDEIG
jgi:hypothetical protein